MYVKKVWSRSFTDEVCNIYAKLNKYLKKEKYLSLCSYWQICVRGGPRSRQFEISDSPPRTTNQRRYHFHLLLPLQSIIPIDATVSLHSCRWHFPFSDSVHDRLRPNSILFHIFFSIFHCYVKRCDYICECRPHRGSPGLGLREAGCRDII